MVGDQHKIERIRWIVKTYKKARFFILSPIVNQSKVERLEALHAEYVKYVQVCVDKMVSEKRMSLAKSEKKSFFPTSSVLSSQIVKNAQDHAITIVNTWVKGKYASKIKKVISRMKWDNEITEEKAIALFSVGKYCLSKPSKWATQAEIDQYWSILSDKGGKPPCARSSLPMRLSEMTCTLADPKKAKSVDLWLSVSSLTKRKTIVLPLIRNPYVSDINQVSKGVLARKTKKGRWRFEVVEKKDWELPPSPQPHQEKIGVDVGLNVLATTSNGEFFGAGFKPKFDRLYQKVKSIRANRQRQGLLENSKRLDRLESRLSSSVKTETNHIANVLVRRHPDTVFVLEDLDLRGCRGQKRFAYRALQKALSLKAPIIKINPAYTSQECPSCGYISRKNRAGTKFQCHSCGRKAHADWVGARNILRRSEDKDISCGDHPNSVKIKLQKRYLLRRNSFVILSDASLPLDQTPNDLVENKELNSIVKIT